MSTLAKPRLSRKDWIEAGLQALVDQGSDALKAEPLARRLKTTKGSFYWHFKDVPEFHAALLTAWRTDAQIEPTGETAVMRLRSLAEKLAQTDRAEPAIRAWAKAHASAAKTIRQIDMTRLSLLDSLLAEIGIANPEMARILYAAALGMRELPDETATGPQAMGTLVDLVLALR